MGPMGPFPDVPDDRTCTLRDGSCSGDPIHYVGGGAWVCFFHWLRMWL